MSALADRDPAYLKAALPFLKLAMKGYFRAEVRDMERVPEGGALLVGNHSGGLLAMDVPIIAMAFADAFGAERPLYCLAHDMMFTGAGDRFFRKFGFVPATRESAQEILSSGAVTIVFPGGDYDTFRPTRRANVVDWAGRTGYVRTALSAGVPIVPVASIGGQEAQLFLTRGEWIGRHAPWRRLLRTDLFPITAGLPFGIVPTFPLNLPLPTKITTQVLEPIDIVAEFGDDPDPAAVDAVVRSRMEETLASLAAERRFPVLG